MADDCVQNSTNDNVAHFKSMKAMNTEASAATSDLILKELEHVISLVGPAKEEITKLQLELTHHQIIPERIGSENAELRCQLETAKREYQELKRQLMNEKHKNEALYNEKVVELQNSNAKIRELEAMKHSTMQKEEIMRAKHKEEIDEYKEANGTTELHLKSVLEKVKELEGAEMRLELRFTDDIRKQQQEITNMTASLRNMTLEKETVEKSLSETKSRLSKLMGDKLSDNNPDIADLSDNNRPTKLGERYQELYDNQWTDAFEVAENYFHDRTESIRIKVLLRILMRAYVHCEQEFKRRDQELLQALYRTSSIEKTRQDLPATMKSLLKELKRFAVTDAIGNLTEGYLDGLDTKTSFGKFNLKVKTYVSECISLCWLMICQDPPIALHMNVKKGEQFDNDRYKHYTVTGTFIDYVVWPALLLYQEGPVLSKGIVQCVKSIQGSKSVKVRSRQVDAAGMCIPTGSVRLSSSENPIDTTKWFSDGISKVGVDNSSTDAGSMDKPGQKQTQKNKNTTNQQDQQELTPQEKQKSANAQDDTKRQHQARDAQQSQQQGPGQHLGTSAETKAYPNRQINQPLHLHRSEARVPLNTSKDGPTQQSSAAYSRTSYYDDAQISHVTVGTKQSLPGNYQQQGHSDTNPTSNKKYQNVSVDNKGQQNQYAAGSDQENRPASGNLLHSFPSTENYQLNQTATGNHQHNQTKASCSVPIQNQCLIQPSVGSIQQLTQASSVADQSEQQAVPFSAQTATIQYPAQLIPTEEEYDMFIEYHNYYRNSFFARYYLGEHIYEKVRNYIAWQQSMQYKV